MIIYLQPWSLLRLPRDTLKLLKGKRNKGTFWGDGKFYLDVGGGYRSVYNGEK